jgi:hypothetical protein
MLDSLFGADMPLPVKFVLAFVVVLALIVAATWLIRRFGAARLGATSARGRQPRLAVIDAASVDARRRLVLIRRDNVEHLVLIGGPTDIVVEQNIVRAVPVAAPREAPPVRAEGMREPAPRPEQAPRPEPAARGAQADAAWMPERTARHAEPSWQPEPQVRPGRPAEPTWTPQPEVPARPRHAEPAARGAPPVDLPTRPLPEPVAAALRAASAPEPARPPAPKPAPRTPAIEPEQPVEVRQSPPTADVNLADMAQRLEAALRRPAAARPAEARAEPPRPEPRFESRPRPATERPAPERPAPERPAPEAARAPAPAAAEPARPPRPAAPAAPAAAAAAPDVSRAPTPEAAPAPIPEPAAKPAEAAAEPKPAPAKSVFDSLEEEMANLLGRPPGKS